VGSGPWHRQQSLFEDSEQWHYYYCLALLTVTDSQLSVFSRLHGINNPAEDRPVWVGCAACRTFDDAFFCSVWPDMSRRQLLDVASTSEVEKSMQTHESHVIPTCRLQTHTPRFALGLNSDLHRTKYCYRREGRHMHGMAAIRV